jgi:hypothetical protein
MDLFFAVCMGIGLALAAILALVALAALVFNRPIGLLARAARRMEGPEGEHQPSARPLGLLVLVVASLIAAASIVFPPIGLLALFAGARMFMLRRSREESKHAGLRVLK